MDSQSALAELKNFQGTRKSAGDYYTQSQNELGVGDARARQDDLKGLIRNTETQLKGVGASVAGRTRGNLVTEAQRARLQNLETQPIAQQLSDRQGAYSDAETNYRDLLSQAGTRAGMSYQTDNDRVTGLQGNYDRLFGQEQAAAEQERWRQQQAEATRQFQETLSQRNREFEQGLANTRAQYAQQASLTSGASSALKAQQEREAAIAKEANRINLSKAAGAASTAQQAAQTTSNRYNTGGWGQQFGNWLADSGSTQLYKLFGGSKR